MYEAKPGDLVRYGSMFGRVVEPEPLHPTMVWGLYDGAPLPSWCQPNDENLSPLRPTAVGQRVRDASATQCGAGTVESVADEPGYRGRIEVRWDTTGIVGAPFLDALVRIADELAKAAGPEPSPRCPDPWHAQPCGCATRWVRVEEPEPLVTGPHTDGPESYWDVGTLGNCVASPTTSEPDRGRARAIAAWRARHG